jgi:hypothetical protein
MEILFPLKTDCDIIKNVLQVQHSMSEQVFCDNYYSNFVYTIHTHSSLSFHWDQVHMAQQIDLHCYKKDVELPLKIVFIASKFQEGIDGCTSIYSTVKVIGRNISYKTLLQHGEKNVI